jgi:hypothetical protein
MAHEMGHHVWNQNFSEAQQAFWAEAVGKSWEQFDLRTPLRWWKQGWDRAKFLGWLKKHKPLWYLRLSIVFSSEPLPGMGSFWPPDSARDFACIVGQANYARLPRIPITVYGATNEQESFCEVFGLLVSRGPRALHREVRRWLQVILPQVKIESLGNDDGAAGKSYEKSFYVACRLAGLKFDEHGARGVAGALWDFAPAGAGWLTLPAGAETNLKTSTARTLFTSTAFWRSVFRRDTREMSDAQAVKLVRRALNKVGLPKVYWLKAKSRDVEAQVFLAATTKDPEVARQALQTKNWSAHRLGTRYELALARDVDGEVVQISIMHKGKRWATIRPRENKRAGNTAGWARLTAQKPKPPYRPLKAEQCRPGERLLTSQESCS